MELFWNFLNGGLPANPRDSLEEANLTRMRLVNAVSGLFLVIATPFLLADYFDEEQASALSLGISLFLAAANLVLLRKTQWVALSGLIFTSLILAHLTVMAVQTPHPAVAYWFFMIPFLGTLLGGLRSGWLLTGVVLVVTVYEFMMPAPENPIILTENRVLSMRIVSTLCVAAFMTIFAVAQRAAERSQRNANRELMTEAARGKLMREVAAAANGAAGVDEVLDTCVRGVCQLTGWQAGVAWQVSDLDEQRKTRAWCLRLDGLVDLRTCAERVWSRGGSILLDSSELESHPVWIEDVAATLDPEFVRAIQVIGLTGGIVVPVHDDGVLVAKLVFFFGPQTTRGLAISELLEHLASQVAHVVVRTRNHERIQALAFYDALTGLPNRQLFQGRLPRALQKAKRDSETLALLFLDLDGFKSVNDSLGHGAGDALLKEVALRLIEGVRSGDTVSRPNPETVTRQDTGTLMVSRLAGDEFTIVLSKVTEALDAGHVCQRLLDALMLPFEIENQEVFITASIGIALYPIDGEDHDTLLAAADAAMYHAKKDGKNQFQYYSESMNVHRARNLKVETRLRHAIERGDLTLHYQPFRDASGANVVAGEALLRWHDEELGDVSPVEFIAVAEKTGLIVQIGSWVLKTACEQMRSWLDQGYRPLRISVNVSGIQLQRGGLVAEVRAMLSDNRLSPAQLELEITESTIMQDDEKTRQHLEEIRCLGVGIALDDFGVGYSSLSYLRRFPIDCVKIDRSFVSGIPENPDDEALTAAVIAMAHGLKLRVVAEGVETVAQAEFLREHDCDELQGYLFGRPVPAEEFERYLERDKPLPT